MRKILFAFIIFIAAFLCWTMAEAQTPLGSYLPTVTNWVKGSLRVDSNLILPSLPNNDVTYFLTTNADGKAVLRQSQAGLDSAYLNSTYLKIADSGTWITETDLANAIAGIAPPDISGLVDSVGDIYDTLAIHQGRIYANEQAVINIYSHINSVRDSLVDLYDIVAGLYIPDITGLQDSVNMNSIAINYLHGRDEDATDTAVANIAYLAYLNTRANNASDTGNANAVAIASNLAYNEGRHNNGSDSIAANSLYLGYLYGRAQNGSDSAAAAADSIEDLRVDVDGKIPYTDTSAYLPTKNFLLTNYFKYNTLPGSTVYYGQHYYFTSGNECTGCSGVDAGYKYNISGTVAYGANASDNDIRGRLNFLNSSGAECYIMQNGSLNRSIKVPGATGNAPWVVSNSAGFGLQIINSGLDFRNWTDINYNSIQFRVYPWPYPVKSLWLNATSNSNINITVGDSTLMTTNGVGYNVKLQAGPGGATNNNKGGDVILQPGGGGGTGAYGNVLIPNGKIKPYTMSSGTVNDSMVVWSRGDSTFKVITIPAGGGGSAAWGSITGTLSSQTDLQTALNGKVDSLHKSNDSIYVCKAGTCTFLTVLSSGGGGSGTVTSVTATDGNGFDFTVTNTTTTPVISATLQSDYNFVTDAEKTVLGNTLGTNTGDQTITLTGDVTGSGTGSFATTIAAGAVDVAMLSATGTPSSTTYLRGDGTWSTPAGGGSSIDWSSQVVYTLAAQANSTTLQAMGTAVLSGSGAAIGTTSNSNPLTKKHRVNLSTSTSASQKTGLSSGTNANNTHMYMGDSWVLTNWFGLENFNAGQRIGIGVAAFGNFLPAGSDMSAYSNPLICIGKDAADTTFQIFTQPAGVGTMVKTATTISFSTTSLYKVQLSSTGADLVVTLIEYTAGGATNTYTSPTITTDLPPAGTELLFSGLVGNASTGAVVTYSFIRLDVYPDIK